MNATGINLNNLNQAAFNASMKNTDNNEPVETEAVKAENNDLTSPMETVGRSMVHFKGAEALTSKELNRLAKGLANTKITSEELLSLKKAIADTMEQYNVKNLKALIDRVNVSLDEALDLEYTLADNIKKRLPSIDYERAADLSGKVAYS